MWRKRGGKPQARVVHTEGELRQRSQGGECLADMTQRKERQHTGRWAQTGWMARPSGKGKETFCEGPDVSILHFGAMYNLCHIFFFVFSNYFKT